MIEQNGRRSADCRPFFFMSRTVCVIAVRKEGSVNRAPTRTPLIMMNEEQHRQMKRMIKECCNYDGGQCLMLDRGDGCVCVQRISYSLICKWFAEAVLPLDRELKSSLLQRVNEKRCAVCGKSLFCNARNLKYCPSCANIIRRQKEAERQRKRYHHSTHFKGAKPL